MTLTGFTRKYVKEIMEGSKTFEWVDTKTSYGDKVRNAFKSMVMEGEITTADYEEYVGEPYEEEA